MSIASPRASFQKIPLLAQHLYRLGYKENAKKPSTGTSIGFEKAIIRRRIKGSYSQKL